MASNLSWQIPLSDVNNTFAVTLVSDQVLTGVTLDDFIFRPVGESTIEANTVATLTNVAGTNNWRLDVTLTGTYDTDFVVRLRPNRVTDADGDTNARLDSNAFHVDSSLTAPDAPTNLSITPSETTAAGSFDASADDGGLAVSDHEYAIEAGSSLSASPTWVSTGSTTTSFTIPSLVADTEYTAVVRAVNSIGESDASDSVTFTTTAAATVVTGYQIQVYDKNYKNDIGDDGTLSRTLTHAVSIRIERDLNRPEKITFQVPRKGDDADAIDIGKVVRVISGTDVIASGIITGPIDKTRPLITVNVLGKAILLSYGILPWDFKLEGSTAEAQVRELLKNYRFFRQNTEDDFNAGTFSDTEVTSVAVSTTETNYFVTLTQTGEDYDASGTFISQPILCTNTTLGDPTGFARLRYVALLGNDTDIKVEFRHSNDAATTAADSVGNWSLWSSEYNTSSDSETQQQLGITGYSISDDFRWVQVRFTLTTSDVSITPALQAFEIVSEYPSEITAGSISIAGDALDETFSFQSHLSAIQRIVAARNAEFRVNDDYTLDVKERFGVTSPTVTYTVHSNCEVIRFQQQDRRLSTEIWSLGSAGSGLTQPFKTSASESATEAYGSRPWIYSPNATTETARTQEIADELALRDTPTNAVVIEETDTTESIEVGDLVSFEYTERSIDTTLRVIAITVADPRLGTPRQIELISDEGFFASQAEAIAGVTQGVTGGVTGTDEDSDILEWGYFQTVDVFSNDAGEFSGVVLSDVEDNLNNPSGATVTLTVPVGGYSNSLTSASINADGDLVIAFTGLAGNLGASVTVEAEATVGGVVRTAPVTIDLRLVFSAGGGVGATGASFTGSTGQSFTGSTGVGQVGSTGASFTGSTGQQGDSIVGSTGQQGADSTVPGPVGATGVGQVGATGQSIVGATGQSIVGATGQQGADSTVPGPVGATGVGQVGATGQSIVGATGQQGADSTVPGPVGATGVGQVGATGQSIVGATGQQGADSTVPGPVGATGVGQVGATGQSIVGATGQSIVGATGQSIVGATGVGQVGATGVGQVGATGQSIVGATGQSIVGATGQSIVGATGVGQVGATGVGQVGATGQSIVGATGQSIVGATGQSIVGATGVGQVGATGQSIVGATGVGQVGATGQSIVGATGVGQVGATGVGQVGATGVGQVGATGVGQVGATGQQGASFTGSTGQQGASFTGSTGQQGDSIIGSTGASFTGSTGQSTVGSTGSTGASFTGSTGQSTVGSTGASFTGETGSTGEAATDEQVSGAVSSYLTENPPPSGETGSTGTEFTYSSTGGISIRSDPFDALGFIISAQSILDEVSGLAERISTLEMS